MRALKELGLGANLRGDEWEEPNGLVLFRGKVYIPLDTQLIPRHSELRLSYWSPSPSYSQT